MNHTKRHARLAIAAIAAFSLAAAACGSDDAPATESTDAPATESTESTDAPATESTDAPATESTDAPATESTDAPATESTDAPMAADGTPIKIGMVYSETGRSSSAYKNVDNVANAWAAWVNADMGGVNGHPVEIIAEDGESTGEGALAAANTLIEAGVVGIVVQDSTAENAIAEAITAAGIPMIGGVANNRPSDSGDAHWPNTYFNTAPSNPGTAASTMLAAKAVGVGNYSAAVCAEVPACAEAGGLYGAVGGIIELDYVGLVTVGAADPSYTAPCLELIGLGAEFINLGLAPSTALSVIDECSLQGFDGLFGMANNSVVAADLEVIDGLQMAGALNGFPWWADAAPVQQFRDVIEQYGDGVDARDPSSTSTWAALELFRKSVGANGPASDAEVTAADVIAVYHGIADETLDGLLSAPVTYTTDGYQPLIPCFWLFEMQGGEFSTISLGDSGNGTSGDLQSSCFSLG